MSTNFKHLVFYDGNCGLCDHVVQFLLKADKQNQFVFAPLIGDTATAYLQKLPPEMRYEDSLILVENYQTPNPQITILGKGALRIAWLLGGPWMLIGWLSFLPGILFDWAYRLVALFRHHFFTQEKCTLPSPDQKNRFLP